MEITEAMAMRDFIQELIDTGKFNEATACMLMAEKVTGRKLDLKNGKLWWGEETIARIACGESFDSAMQHDM